MSDEDRRWAEALRAVRSDPEDMKAMARLGAMTNRLSSFNINSCPPCPPCEPTVCSPCPPCPPPIICPPCPPPPSLGMSEFKIPLPPVPQIETRFVPVRVPCPVCTRGLGQIPPQSQNFGKNLVFCMAGIFAVALIWRKM